MVWPEPLVAVMDWTEFLSGVALAESTTKSASEMETLTVLWLVPKALAGISIIKSSLETWPPDAGVTPLICGVGAVQPLVAVRVIFLLLSPAEAAKPKKKYFFEVAEVKAAAG